MPNWCENDLTVSGNKRELEKFKASMAGKDCDGKPKLLDENALIPYPEEFGRLDEVRHKWDKETERLLASAQDKGEKAKIRAERWSDAPKDGFNSGGYEWCVRNWGMKWGFCEVEMTDEWYNGEEGEITYTFGTAWSPPSPLIRKMGELFPELDFELRYFERGAGFNGMLRMEKGKETVDKCAEYFGDRGG